MVRFVWKGERLQREVERDREGGWREGERGRGEEVKIERWKEKEEENEKEVRMEKEEMVKEEE